MANDTKNFDLVILGGGPAGIAAATTASASGKTVAMIDNHHEVGGAGVNTGTVPSKTLRETALALSGMKSRDLYGVDLSVRRELTVKDFLGHKQHVKRVFNSTFLKRLHDQHTQVFFGAAKFVDANTVEVKLLKGLLGAKESTEPVQLRADKILIATGSSPTHPELFNFKDTEVYDSDTILQLRRIPKTMAIIGAGVIGSEYASTFAALGAQVHVIDGRDQLLPFLDCEVSRALAEAMTGHGVQFLWKETVKACEPAGDGPVTLTFESGKKLTVDAVLVAAGRQSNTDSLALDCAGVTTGKRGVIPVNEHYQTSMPHIYAAGDVIGFPALASTSMEQSRRAVAHALGLPMSNLSPLLPNGIYTIPEVSMIGETEESLKKSGVEYVVGRTRYDEGGRGQIIGDHDGFLKLLFRKADMKLVGVHVMGETATDVVHIGLMAMLTKSTAEVFVEACFNVPTLGQMYKLATLDALRAKDAPRKEAAAAQQQ
jgi:NAD(P) transhydrogenase